MTDLFKQYGAFDERDLSPNVKCTYEAVFTGHDETVPSFVVRLAGSNGMELIDTDGNPLFTFGYGNSEELEYMKSEMKKLARVDPFAFFKDAKLRGAHVGNDYRVEMGVGLRNELQEIYSDSVNLRVVE